MVLIGYMKRFRLWSLAELIALNCAVVAASAVVGWMVSTSRWAAGHGSFQPEWRGSLAPLPLALRLGWANLQAVALILLGAVALGVYALAAIAANSYGVGVLFADLLHVYGAQGWLLLAYAPFEFLALAMAAAVSQRLSILIVRNLVFHEPLRARALLAALGGVVALVALAAVIEAHVGQRFAYGPLAAKVPGGR